MKIASGTTDPREFQATNDMVTKLKHDRRWDLLALLAQHQLTPAELYDAIYRGALNELPSADDARPLVRAIERWLPGADLVPNTREEYRRILIGKEPKEGEKAQKRPNALSLPAGARLGDLPTLTRERRTWAVETGKRAAFNRFLMAARSFVGGVFGASHRLATQLADIEPLEETPRHGNPQEPDQIRALCTALPRLADMIWALCLSGMRRGEYWGPHRWELTADRILIHGTKSQAGRRVAPLIYRIATPTIGYSGFYHALTKHTDGLVIPHDLRKTHQRWLEDAGVPDWRIKLYAGHAAARKDLATIYRRPRDLTRLLVEDGERLRQWLGEPPSRALQVVGER